MGECDTGQESKAAGVLGPRGRGKREGVTRLVPSLAYIEPNMTRGVLFRLYRRWLFRTIERAAPLVCGLL